MYHIRVQCLLPGLWSSTERIRRTCADSVDIGTDVVVGCCQRSYCMAFESLSWTVPGQWTTARRLRSSMLFVLQRGACSRQIVRSTVSEGLQRSLLSLRLRACAVPLPFPTLPCVAHWPCFSSNAVCPAAVMPRRSWRGYFHCQRVSRQLRRTTKCGVHQLCLPVAVGRTSPLRIGTCGKWTKACHKPHAIEAAARDSVYRASPSLCSSSLSWIITSLCVITADSCSTSAWQSLLSLCFSPWSCF